MSESQEGINLWRTMVGASPSLISSPKGNVFAVYDDLFLSSLNSKYPFSKVITPKDLAYMKKDKGGAEFFFPEEEFPNSFERTVLKKILFKSMMAHRWQALVEHPEKNLGYREPLANLFSEIDYLRGKKDLAEMTHGYSNELVRGIALAAQTELIEVNHEKGYLISLPSEGFVLHCKSED